MHRCERRASLLRTADRRSSPAECAGAGQADCDGTVTARRTRSVEPIPGRLGRGVTSYSATVTVFEQNGTAAQNVVFDYTFKKPSNVTVHVAKGMNSGVTLDWSGGSTIIAHRGSGFAALLEEAVPPARRCRHDDSWIVDRRTEFRGNSPAPEEHAGNRFGGSGPRDRRHWKRRGNAVPAAPGVDAGLTSEVVDLSSTTAMPMSVLGYDGPTLVRKIDFSNVKLQR